MAIILAFLMKHLDKVVIVVLVTAVLGYAYVTGRKHERQVWQPKYDSLVATYRAAGEQAKADVAAAEQAAKESNERVVAHYEERVLANDAALQSALGQLRQRTSVRALAKASDAPAACRAYETSPAQLSEQDAEILIRDASRADALAQQLNSLIEYTTELYALTAKLP